ncbi:MAG: helix-turn-helix domain-containing protein [Lachnospiraceae bacterium]
MNSLNIAENLIRLRREKGITQEELAGRLGVTKASVSKWETKQSMPDIVLLPLIASFYDVTVDELLGYEPQLDKKQIQKLYLELATEFAEKPFEQVMHRCRELVRNYYSCYPFLIQMCVLWLNHFMLAKEKELQQEILEETLQVCEHILSGCKDIGICKETVFLKATIELQLGKAEETIVTLEEMLNPYYMDGQGDAVLIQAYQMTGKHRQADSYTQISMFLHLLVLLGDATQFLQLHAGEPEVCDETIRRIDSLIECWRFQELHPNSVSLYHYSAALVYCTQQRIEAAMEHLKQFVFLVRRMARNGMTLHGDDYFSLISEWFENQDLGGQMVRDKKFILESASSALEHPAFAVLKEEEEFTRLKQLLTEQ